MKILLIGNGSIAQKHKRLLCDILSHEVIVQSRIESWLEWQKAESLNPDYAVIANATHVHIQTAIELARRNIPFMLEKPIGSSLNGLYELIQEVKARNITTYVAYPLRHHVVLQALKDRIVYPINFAHIRCRTNGREWPRIRRTRAEGGGALLELSHEIDLARWMFGEIVNIRGTVERKTDLLVDCEDFAKLTVTHESGQDTRVTLDLTHGYTEREILTDGEYYYARREYSANKQMYVEQFRFFEENLNNPGMMNNLPEAAGLFRKILEFRDLTST